MPATAAFVSWLSVTTRRFRAYSRRVHRHSFRIRPHVAGDPDDLHAELVFIRCIINT